MVNEGDWMGKEGGEAAREALAATVASVLRQQARHSAHPADQAALRLAAARIAVALQAEFLVVSRYSSVAEQADRPLLSSHPHE